MKNSKTKTRQTPRLPAIQGGKPVFAKKLPITEPTVPLSAPILKRYREILNSRMLTNGPTVLEFESAAARYIGVKHAVAVSTCTNGLILTMKSMGLKGEVILPSFTFHATAHACVWNGLTPVLVDCDPETYTIDPEQVERAITPSTCAIIGVHIFGCPAKVDVLEDIARKRGLKLIFDAAHALGSLYKGRKVGGFGNAECFSLSPTKLVTAGEGGLVATNDDELARRLRVGRNYGDSGNYDCEFSGLNARMSELHAALGLESLKMLEKNIARRLKLVRTYARRLAKIPGVSLQAIPDGSRTTFKDFSILVDAQTFGLTRDRLYEALSAENIMVKKYFYPPVHWQKLFKECRRVPESLPNTELVSLNALSLPLSSHMSEQSAGQVCRAIEDIRGALVPAAASV